MHEAVTMPEAVAVLGLGEDQIRFMLGDGDRPLPEITVRQLLGCRVTAELIRGLQTELAVSIGVTAAHYAEPGAGRLLVTAWPGGEPRCAWHPAGEPFAPLPRPFVSVPADDWLDDLTARLAEHRAAAARPN